MQEPISMHQSLSDVDDSLFIVIDVQQKFLDKLTKEQVEPLVNRIRWLIQIAGELNVPVVATAEDIPALGSTIPKIAAVFPKETKEHNKMSFGLTKDPDIMSEINAAGRKTAVLMGLETDVCVMQSALGLLRNGFRVVVLSDAIASPGPCHDAGIIRMQNAGVIISTVKGTFYEWVRTVDFSEKRLDKRLWEPPQPNGIYL
jgi:nicotinamidase-related amidase